MELAGASNLLSKSGQRENDIQVYPLASTHIYTVVHGPCQNMLPPTHIKTLITIMFQWQM